MSDPATEKLQNLSIQDHDINPTDFDPYSAQNTVAFGDISTNLQGQQIANGLEPMSVDQSDLGTSAKQLDDQEFQNQDFVQGTQTGIGRKMSEREMLGYQNDYGGTFQSSAQMEYIIDSDEEDDRNNFVDMGADAPQQRVPPTASDQQYYINTGQPLLDLGSDVDGLSSDNQITSPDTSQLQSEDILGSPDILDETGAGVQTMDYIDPENWAPHPDAARSRRSRSPERSLSPPAHERSSLSDANIPKSDSDQMDRASDKSSKSDKKDPKHKVGHIPRPLGSPRVSKAKKPLELPPWNDNVVIPPPPRMKPTLIGREPDLPSPPRPKTAPLYRKQDASSDSGVEEDKSSKSDRKASADAKKRYGIDSKNVKYKPQGGNIKIFDEKVDTKSVGARTDSSKPRASMSPRGSVSSDKSPLSPRLPSPNVKNIQSKIGSMDNTKHTPGGGNVKVLSAKVDYSNVGSKVGSKDKIHHKPQGGDKKIQSAKLNWSAESKVGSMKNAAHSPGGGNVKQGDIEDESGDITQDPDVNTSGRQNRDSSERDDRGASRTYATGSQDRWAGSTDRSWHQNPGYKPQHSEIEYFEEALDWDAEAKVNSLENAGYTPGGGNVKIFSEKLKWRAEPKVDTNLRRGTQSGGQVHLVVKDQSLGRYSSSKHPFALDIETDEIDGLAYNTGSVDLYDSRLHDKDKEEVEKDSACKLSQVEKPQNVSVDNFDNADSHKCLPLPAVVVSNISPVLMASSKETPKKISGKQVVDIGDSADKCVNIDDGKQACESDTTKSEIQEYQIVKAEIESSEERISDTNRSDCNEVQELEDGCKSLEHSRLGNHTVIEEKPKGKGKRLLKACKNVLFAKSRKKGKENEGTKDFHGSKKSSKSQIELKRLSELEKTVMPKTALAEGKDRIKIANLGYESPKMSKKIAADRVTGYFIGGKLSDTDLKGSKSKVPAQDPRTRNKNVSETVIKLANLGYGSPKLRKKVDQILVTGRQEKIEELKYAEQGCIDLGYSEINSHLTSMRELNLVEGYEKQPVKPVSGSPEIATVTIHENKTDDIESNCNSKDILDVVDKKCDRVQQCPSESTRLSYAITSKDYEEIDFSDKDNNGLKSSSTPICQTIENDGKNIFLEIEKGNMEKCDLRSEDKHNDNSVSENSVCYRTENLYSTIKKMAKTKDDNSDSEEERFETKIELTVNKNSASDKNKSVDTGAKNLISDFKNNKWEKSVNSDSSCGDNCRKICQSCESENSAQYSEQDQWVVRDNKYTHDSSQAKLDAVGKNITNVTYKYSEGGAGRSGKEPLEKLGHTDDESFLNILKSLDSSSDKVTEKYKRDMQIVLANDAERPEQTGNSIQAEKSLDDGQTPVLKERNIVARLDNKNFVNDKENNSRSTATTLNIVPEIRKIISPDNVEDNQLGRSEAVRERTFKKGALNITVTPLASPRNSFNLGTRSKTVRRSLCDHNAETAVVATELERVINERPAWSAKSKIGSLDNAQHSPGGGKIKILDQKVEVKAQSKIGSTANIKHKPGGGDKRIETVKVDFTASAKSKVGSMDNVKHKAAGGDIKVRDEKISWEATSKVGSLDNVKHVAGGGTVKIFDEKPEFVEKASPKVGSMDKVTHQPGGGDKKIETQKLSFKETAKARTDSGPGSKGEKPKSQTSSRCESVASQGSSSTQD